MKVKSKKQLKAVADKLWYEILMLKHPYCEVCGKPAVQIHHFYYKGSFGHLRYELDNGIGLCKGCHFLLHHKDPKPIEEAIISRRGAEWHNGLKEKANQRPVSFYAIKWLQSHLDRLNEEYIKL